MNKEGLFFLKSWIPFPAQDEEMELWYTTGNSLCHYSRGSRHLRSTHYPWVLTPLLLCTCSVLSLHWWPLNYSWLHPTLQGGGRPLTLGVVVLGTCPWFTISLAAAIFHPNFASPHLFTGNGPSGFAKLICVVKGNALTTSAGTSPPSNSGALRPFDLLAAFSY